jgi:hypothetical protein
MDPEPITAQAAAKRLGKQPATIRKWAERYGARQLGRIERKVYYDYNDLSAIDAYLYEGEPVPATPEERAKRRDRYKTAA